MEKKIDESTFWVKKIKTDIIESPSVRPTSTNIESPGEISFVFGLIYNSGSPSG